MKFVWDYVRQHRKGIAFIFLSCGIFCVSFLLYRLPLRAVLYPAFLCTLCGVGLAAADFSGVMKRHRKLCAAGGELTADTAYLLPGAEGITERDYQELIRMMQDEAAARDGLSSARYQNMIEYYTLWAHQIKTPITSMHLTLEKEDTPFSRKISSDLFWIEQYVEMVLAYLKLDGDSGDYVFREYDLDGIIKQSVMKFTSEFIARKIRLCYTPVEKKVVTDDKWLSFVIEQVLSNALKYTKEGSVKIYMCGPDTLCIEDTGIGIAQSDLPRVFEKGYTGYNGRTDKRASGIGLYLCRQICEKLGAGIGIESEPGRGTCVLLDLRQYDLKKE